MTTFKIGICDYPYDRERYHSAFPLVEHRVGLVSPPKPRVLRRWARQAPAGFEHVWVASQHFTHDVRSIRTGRPMELEEGEAIERRGLFQDTPENHRAWQQVLSCIEAVSGVLAPGERFDPARPKSTGA